ncbi:colicin V production CvpA [Solemya pervernicosa gill symbiont]|uniref:Colicin V production CvpA n=2 Tax=Gammaproteobacteria incertae sedis TaxID=118884 RepID=A0A1T2L6T8_9GAMM|nr:CvpA family protein [Candidatus Reidiella endopervernicosa]OOZ40825.1 colicin V production CvpA [Solemya pervernicosa gill symbiont]QKQ26336.1 CvpA family protein [Candidatus Reidiella endopervernicosa]
MIWIDYVILTIVAISMVISVSRGFVREALSLVIWIAAFWIALTFSNDLALRLEGMIDTPSARMIAAFAILFLATLIVGGLTNFLIGQLVKKTGLGGTDRAVGMLFGIARGVLIVAIIVVFAGLTPLPQDPWWGESTFLVHFQRMAIWMISFLPAEYAGNFSY